MSGQVTVQNPKAEMTVVLTDSRGNVMYSMTLTGDGSGQSVPFVLENVTSGVYDMIIRVRGCLDVVIHNIPLDDDMDLSASLNESIAHVTPVTGDINGDGSVDLADVAMLTSTATYGKPCEDALSKDADLNGDGVIDLADLAILTSTNNYGKEKVEIYY